jgi:hypothetical protein
LPSIELSQGGTAAEHGRRRIFLEQRDHAAITTRQSAAGWLLDVVARVIADCAIEVEGTPARCRG